jgi:hypothetical protein
MHNLQEVESTINSVGSTSKPVGAMDVTHDFGRHDDVLMMVYSGSS